MAGVNYTTSVVGLRDRWNIDFEEGLMMAENKMEQVAALFGKKLGEPFTVYVPFHKCKNEAMFDAHGLSIKSYGEWHYDSDYLMWLLTGDAKIVEE